MMDFETASNQSDDLKSSISSFSGGSLYQNEFAELRHLVDPDRYPTPIHDRCSTPTHNDSGCDLQYEDRITDLSHQLQNVLKLNEQYKNNLFELESKCHNKIEILLRQNNRLKLDLRNANEQVERLLGNFVNRTEQFVLPEKPFIDLERKCHDLTLQNSYLQTQLLEVTKEKDEFESLNKQMRIELNEYKSEVANKTVCVAELKDKISEQFVELQSSCRSKNALTQHLEQAKSEVEHLQKAREWYKQQLSQAQADKRNLTEDLLQCKLNLSTTKETLEVLKIELKTWKNKFDTLQLDTLKEKETLLQEIKTLTLAKNSNGDITEVINDNNESLMNLYRCEIQDLQKKIFHINEIIKEQDEALKKLTRENSELTSRCVTLQKTMQQKEYFLEKLEQDKMQLLTELDMTKDDNKDKSNEVLLLKNELNKYETELSTKNTEKGVIESSIKTIRGQFSALKLQYDKQKHEIMEKNKQILHLQTEKQELFMNNNWKVCELEKAKEKDTLLDRLRNELVKKDCKINNSSEIIRELKAEIIKNEEVNEDHLHDKEILVEKHSQEIERYESVLLQYRKTVEDYKNQIHHLQDIVEAKTFSLTELESTIASLQTEIKNKDITLTELAEKCDTLTAQLVSNKENEPEDNKGRDKNAILIKFRNLTNRVKNLEQTIENSSQILNNLQKKNSLKNSESASNDNELKVLLQVKELEIQEKQRKYERNYRTLLRKIKEHMKGRTSAEKQSNYLQDLYNELSDQSNTLKLTLNNLQMENDNNKTLLRRHVNIIETLKEKLLKYEVEREKNKSCEKCLEYDTLTERLVVMEEFVQTLRKQCVHLESLVLDKEDMNRELQEKIRDMTEKLLNITSEKNNYLRQNEDLLSEKNKLIEEIKSLDGRISMLTISSNKLQTTLETEIEQNKSQSFRVSSLTRQLEEAEDRIKCLNEEIELSTTFLHNKTEEIRTLEEEKSNIKAVWIENIADKEKVMEDLKKTIDHLHAEIDANKREKYFVQRLCNDLKLALKSHISYNKVLKEQLNRLSKEKDEFNSLPVVLPQLPIPEKYNEQYVNELLQQNKMPPQDKPLSDIQTSLDSLKREIFTLQEQVLKKNLQNIR